LATELLVAGSLVTILPVTELLIASLVQTLQIRAGTVTEVA
jgi:hypothetical protein